MCMQQLHPYEKEEKCGKHGCVLHVVYVDETFDVRKSMQAYDYATSIVNMVVQKVAIVKNMLVYTICYTFNVGTNKTMVVEDTTMQIVVVAYILVVDNASTIEVIFM